MLQWIRAIIVVTIKRLLAQPGLALATTLGLVVVITLTMSIPLYADSIYYHVFFAAVSSSDSGARSPFTLMFQYRGSQYGDLKLEDIQPEDDYLAHPESWPIQLPATLSTQYVATKSLGMYIDQETTFSDRNLLKWVAFAYVRDIATHITISEGQFPEIAPVDSDQPVEVLVSEAMAVELGLQVGEQYLIYARERSADGLSMVSQIPVRIAGVWQAKDLDDNFWFVQPQFLNDQLIVPEATFAGRISAALPDEVETATWYTVLDGSGMNYDASRSLLTEINEIEQAASSLLPDTRLVLSPRENLRQYQQSFELLTALLFVFAIPVFGLLLAFIVLTTGLVVEHRRNEIAILRSRGATTAHVVGVAILEATLTGVTAWLLATPLSLLIASAVGRSRGFLDLSGSEQLQVNLSATPLIIGLAAAAFTIIAQVLPSLGVSKLTIVAYKQSQARSIRPPLWQRLWLDVLLIFPTAYGIFVLTQQGGILGGQTDAGAGSLADNPLVFLVPSLAILTATLLMLRIVPALYRLLAWGLARTDSVAALMAARHLARTPSYYSTPLVLLILTLSLSAFTASLAQTLDMHLHDQAYYNLGTDLQFYEFGETNNLSLTPNPNEPGDRVYWRFLPVSEYLQLPGVVNATRVGRYEGVMSLQGQIQSGTYLGVDRYDFARIAFWRYDFARESLNGLMNALALKPDGVLIPTELMNAYSLKIGDSIRVTVRTAEREIPLDLSVVGSFDLFPTWYPSDGPLYVGNLDYFFEQAGGGYPYDVWLELGSSADLHAAGQQILAWKSPLVAIDAALNRPENQGLIGLLSIGFGAAAVLTVIGFLLYILFSFRQRMIELGVLRAVGLSSGQMAAFLAWELMSLVLLGGLIGTGIGTLASQVFIPFLQVGTDAASITPPFLVQIAWSALLRMYLLFGLLFVASLVGLVFLLRRMKIFQAIKLGETV